MSLPQDSHKRTFAASICSSPPTALTQGGATCDTSEAQASTTDRSCAYLAPSRDTDADTPVWKARKTETKPPNADASTSGPPHIKDILNQLADGTLTWGGRKNMSMIIGIDCASCGTYSVASIARAHLPSCATRSIVDSGVCYMDRKRDDPFVICSAPGACHVVAKHKKFNLDTMRCNRHPLKKGSEVELTEEPLDTEQMVASFLDTLLNSQSEAYCL